MPHKPNNQTLQAPVKLMPLPEQVKHICALRAQGKTYREIQQETELSLATISSRLSNEQAKEILEEATKHHIRSLPLALARHDEIIASDDEAIALKAIETRYKITGIVPSHAASVYIQHLQVVGHQTVLDPRIAKLLGTQMLDDGEVIDVEEE